MTTSTCFELVLPAAATSIRRARSAVGDAVDELGRDGRVVDDVRLCVSEAVTNVVRHAYGGYNRGDVTIRVDRDGDEIDVVVSDTGVGCARSRSKRPNGGYGHRIIESLANRWSITSEGGRGTELHMVFGLDKAPRARHAGETTG